MAEAVDALVLHLAYSLAIGSLYPKLDDFARAPEEREALVADLLRNLVEASCSIIYGDLLRAEHTDPQKIFRAHSPMARVAFEE